MKKLVHGYGINDADYNVVQRIDGKEVRCPFYTKWVEMLKHCYCPKYQAKFETYKIVSLCYDWHWFTNFKAWMETKDWKGKDLDKDLLTNERIYSPDTCLFIPHKLNCFLTKSNKARGEFPIGVGYYKNYGNYVARVSVDNKTKHLGYFDTPEEAHKAWQQGKIGVIEIMLQRYGDDPLIRKGLERISGVILEDMLADRETVDF